jgi:N-formylglutamate amidohydrolase
MEECHFIAGPANAETPVLLSVPHAGRQYPAAMNALTRLSAQQLMSLEDRHADHLCVSAADSGHNVIIAKVARAWIDLNRAEDELDPGMFADRPAGSATYRLTAKVRGGLGLIPRRIANGGDIWRQPLHLIDLEDRIAGVHRPYHRIITAALRDRQQRFGCAVLLDIHSMPPIKDDRQHRGAHLVVGNLYGRAASQALTNRIAEEGRAAGFHVAVNAPYAGGHILERHALPRERIHALQLEIDRSLYLDCAMNELGKGAPAIGNLIRRIADALAEEVLSANLAIAAE